VLPIFKPPPKDSDWVNGVCGACYRAATSELLGRCKLCNALWLGDLLNSDGLCPQCCKGIKAIAEREKTQRFLEEQERERQAKLEQDTFVCCKCGQRAHRLEIASTEKRLVRIGNGGSGLTSGTYVDKEYHTCMKCARWESTCKRWEPRIAIGILVLFLLTLLIVYLAGFLSAPE
jgi:hypothetical protein